MKINNNIEYIRQQQLGQFRRPEDGKEPYAYVGNQKLKSTNEPEESSVYVNDEIVVTFGNDLRSDFPNLFDYDAGLRLDTEKTAETKKEEKLHPQYDKTGKTQIITEKTGLIDQLA